MTLSKLAKLANVSVSTASKAFSMSSEVNEDTRLMIFDTAKKYGCFKKFFNAKYPKTVVAIVCPETRSRYYSEILNYLQYEFGNRNCEICIASTGFSIEKQTELLNYYDKYSSVDGIVLLDGKNQNFIDYEIPIVRVIGNDTENSKFPAICLDYRDAVYEAVKYWSNNNITDIGFIGEYNTQGKKEMFITVLTEIFGFADSRFIEVTDKRFEAGGYEAMEKFYDNKLLPKAIICAYDYMAIGAIRCIRDYGGSVPEDIAVIGMDNIPETDFLNPRLSSIGIPIDAICSAAVDTFFSMLMNEPYVLQKKFNASLILRESSLIS